MQQQPQQPQYTLMQPQQIQIDPATQQPIYAASMLPPPHNAGELLCLGFWLGYLLVLSELVAALPEQYTFQSDIDCKF